MVVSEGSQMPTSSYQHLQQRNEPEEVDLLETVDWSCCCCPRRTGIMILGASFLIASSVALLFCAQELVKLDEFLYPTLLALPLKPTATTPPNKKPMPSPPKMQPHPKAPAPYNHTLWSKDMEILKGVRALLITQAVVAAAGVLCAILLLCGAWFRRRVALVPWMACAAAEVALLLGGGLYCVSVSMSHTMPVFGLDGFFALVIMFLFCVPVLYCLLAVRTFYSELKGPKNNQYNQSRTSLTLSQPSTIASRPQMPPPPPPQGPPRAYQHRRAHDDVYQDTTTQAGLGYQLKRGQDNPVYQNTAL